MHVPAPEQKGMSMLIRREEQTPRELYERALAAREAAQAVRLASREIVAACTESRIARDGSRRVSAAGRLSS